MKIIYEGGIAILQAARDQANALLTNPDFYDAIARKKGFDFTTATGQQVSESMQRCELQITVKTYKKYGTRTLGYTNPTDPTSIYINVAAGKLKRSLASIVGTFIHEAVHAADADDELLDYPHRGNRAAGNDDTAPYWIGNLAIEMTDKPLTEIVLKSLPTTFHALGDRQPSFILQVTVRDGENSVINFSIDGPVSTGGSRTHSFSQSFSLPSGAYDLTVWGANPFEGSTTVALSGDFDGSPVPNASYSSNAPTYRMAFSFIIA